MLAALGHMDFMPLIYGAIMFFGIWSMVHKIARGKIFAALLEIGVFVLVFKLHGGTMAGGFAAMVCALLAGSFLPVFYRRKK